MTIQAGQRAAAADVLAAIAAPGQLASSGHFYSDLGASIVRYGDRLLVGAATDCQAKANRGLTTDWLSTVMASTSVGAYAVWGATTASIARYGTMGLLGASRTSDARASAGMLGYTPATIGVASWAIDDDTASTRTTTAYAYYGEVWRMPGVGYQPGFGMEIECVNLGGSFVGTPSPAAPNVGGGLVGVQIGSGGGQTATGSAAAALVVVPNPSQFLRGIVFDKGSLAGVDSSGNGYAEALSLARGQAIALYAQDGGVALILRSTVTAGAHQTRIEAQDAGLVMSNASGAALFTVATMASPVSTLSVQAGAGAGAPGLYVQQGSGGSANLGLFPASGGELQIQSPVGNAGGGLPGTAGGGFLHININGSDLRIPLLTPAQAGT